MHQQEGSRRACCSLSSGSRTAGSQDRYPQKDTEGQESGDVLSKQRTHCADSEGESPAREQPEDGNFRSHRGTGYFDKLLEEDQDR